MKIVTTIFAAATIIFFSACGDSTEHSMTSNEHSSSGSEHKMEASGSGLMKSMNDMMGAMHSMTITGDFDVDFANMMIGHHQGAIDMAQIELSQGKDATMKAKAQDIISKQQKEQQEFKDFVQTYKPSGMKYGEADMQKLMSTMTENMKSMQMSGDVDKDFATMMIPHHQDGIDMAKLEIKHGMSDKMKKIAENVIADQTKEIEEFKTWLSSNK
jgi:uncharacterized protein (DUF305 family)